MIFRKKSESAVSPVIGTILLVAITVVLVAIIAAVVMGMSGSVSNSKNVGLTVTPGTWDYGIGEDGTISVLAFTAILHGGKDLSQLRSLNISLDGTPMLFFVIDHEHGGTLNSPAPAVSAAATLVDLATFHASELTGQPLYYVSIPNNGRTEKWDNALYVVTGTFADGTTAVLYQGRISYETPSGGRHIFSESNPSDIISQVEAGYGMFSPIITT